MLARDMLPRTTPQRPIRSAWNRLLPPEMFRLVLEAEVLRHHRYLHGFGILRIGPRVEGLGVDALRESFETETRQTDSAAALPDGSCALIALSARPEHLEHIARRLCAAAQAIQQEYEDEPATYVVGLAATSDRRVDADEMWQAASRAYGDARARIRTLVIAP
jgi:hypothetical protein